ncbi:MAG: ISAzo13 family transposase [Planctomycetes bacterium]|nr:ISAzo13 family transposase [Planctomycetota bacterium]
MDTRVVRGIQRKFRALRFGMDERMRRQWAAVEARDLEWGGVSAVAVATGLARPTIHAGLRELDLLPNTRHEAETRVRRVAGGRRPLAETNPGLLPALDALMDPVTRGSPESALRWTCKSTQKLADELTRQDHPVRARTVAAVLQGIGDSLQASRKTREGALHPVRKAPFAANSTRRWWTHMGQARFPRARKLLITADGGGSRRYRSRLWRVALQDLADALELTLCVGHSPPGTSKWNKIEHRLFSFITRNWRGRSLVTHQAIVNLIASSTTRTGLVVKAALDTELYETAVKVSDEELARFRLKRDRFHGDWNYTLTPRSLEVSALFLREPQVVGM